MYTSFMSSAIFLMMFIKDPYNNLAAWGFIISLVVCAVCTFIHGTRKEKQNETYVQFRS